jgi:1,4-dihydroxy-2-naphthoyl-CoA hydrolase
MGGVLLATMLFTPAHAHKAMAMREHTLLGHLDIRFLVDDQGRLCANMPVDHRTHQPMGLLHGGATAALAESLGSVASALLIDLDKQAVVGLEVSVNHLKGVRSGTVTATGELLHHGRTTHVWDIRVRNEQDELVAVCRLTNLVIERR